MPAPVRSPIYRVGDLVDTDQIIPAMRLVLNPAIDAERRELGRYAMEGLPSGHPPFVEPGTDQTRYAIMIAGRNFGCGSSREHAPVALAASGVKAVVAASYSRIFFRNCVNGGYLYPFEAAERLADDFKTGDGAEIDLEAAALKHLGTGRVYRLKPLDDAKAIIDAGGIFRFKPQAAARNAGPWD